MTCEIERKFLVTQSLHEILDQHQGYNRVSIRQSYLNDSGKWTVRVRETVGVKETTHHLTTKRKLTDVTCTEIEIPIDEASYKTLREACGVELSKHRYLIRYAGHCWELDKFLNPALNGLMIAEIELQSEDEAFIKPPWLGQEVTYDRQYKNAKLVKRLGGSTDE